MSQAAHYQQPQSVGDIRDKMVAKRDLAAHGLLKNICKISRWRPP